jgi:hypothetical protein
VEEVVEGEAVGEAEEAEEAEIGKRMKLVTMGMIT